MIPTRTSPKQKMVFGQSEKMCKNMNNDKKKKKKMFRNRIKFQLEEELKLKS